VITGHGYGVAGGRSAVVTGYVAGVRRCLGSDSGVVAGVAPAIAPATAAPRTSAIPLQRPYSA
jgi:hypothetical protein